MKKILFVLGAVAFLAVPSWAQLYNDKHDATVNSVDRAAMQATEMYSDVPAAGAKEEALTQDVRYQNMTEPMNEANEHHFDEGAKDTTIVDKSEK
jgi:hypothetical protein